MNRVCGGTSATLFGWFVQVGAQTDQCIFLSVCRWAANMPVVEFLIEHDAEMQASVSELGKEQPRKSMRLTQTLVDAVVRNSDDNVPNKNLHFLSSGPMGVVERATEPICDTVLCSRLCACAQSATCPMIDTLTLQ